MKRKIVDLALEVDVDMLFDARPRRGQRVKVRRIDGRALKLPRGVRYWFTVRTIGGDLDVVLANGKILRDLKDRVGVTHADVGLIALDEDTPYVRLVVGLLHELCHACFSTPGEHNLLMRIFGTKTEKQTNDREEEVVTHFAPKFADCMLRSGLLRLPPLPSKRRRVVHKRAASQAR